MKVTNDQIQDHNSRFQKAHTRELEHLVAKLETRDFNIPSILQKIGEFNIAIPSWALGSGGTRFGRFPIGGEPRSLEEKIEDVGLLHKLNRSSGAISLHIPWDIPGDYESIRELALSYELSFDAVNSNTFQDQEAQKFSYKFGSLCHTDKEVRQMAVDHNKDVIDHGIRLGSKSLTVWLADGSSFPGQLNFRKALERTHDSLKEIYDYLPDDWRMFIEYKPFEPYFYSMVIPDWGTSFLLASVLGDKAFSLVDLGHHLPNTNIEQIVATLYMQGKLGGFHFNDSKFADDDLTVGAIKPYQLFLIFNELLYGMENNLSNNPPLAWMIDASHNLKDPLEDLIQSVEAIKIAFTQALIVDTRKLEAAREENDVTLSQQIIQEAFRTDVRPLIAEARIQDGGVYDPLTFYRKNEVRATLIKARGKGSKATGL